MSLSKHLRARRYEAGALQLASPEVKFQFDSERTTDPMDVGMYQVRMAMRVCGFAVKCHLLSMPFKSVVL